MQSWWVRVMLGVTLLCLQAGAYAQSSAPAVEASAFMEAYGSDLRSGDRAAVAARYDSRGAYFMGNGRKQYRTAEEIRQRYLGSWRPPLSFAWRELSFEPLGEQAVLVLGKFDWGSADAGVVTYSYTGLLLREGQTFKIRIEDESKPVLPQR